MFVFLLIFLFGLTLVYQFVLDIFFSNYDFLLKYGIQVASQENYFMNYGYWKTANSMLQANKDLVNYFFDMADIKSEKNLHILDVGCGYGEQDFLWLRKLDPSCRITAIDIAENQIRKAQEKADEKDKEGRIHFEVADACKLPYRPNTFTTAFSVESAFHYPRRFKFFKDVHKILEKDGKFVICDIMLQDGYKHTIFSKSFLKVFSDLLSIPKQNLIPASEWEKQIQKAGFKILKSKDITELTFEPYYKHFFENWFKNLYLPVWFANPFKAFFSATQPFAYRLVVCQKN